jgi:hypothetical protein
MRDQQVPLFVRIQSIRTEATARPVLHLRQVLVQMRGYTHRAQPQQWRTLLRELGATSGLIDVSRFE